MEATRFYRLYPNLQGLHEFLNEAENDGASIKGLHGTYIRQMGRGISRKECTTFYISTERIVTSIGSTIFKVRRCPDQSVEFKAYNSDRWILYDRSVRTPPRLRPAHQRARSRSRSRSRRHSGSRSRARRHRSSSRSSRRSGSTHSRSGSANSR